MSNPDAGPDGSPWLTIGAVARLTGKSASAIRYYEQIGLLPRPARAGGRRRYDQAAVRTLAVIETGQRAGLALDEIKVLLSASPGDPAAVERLREVASRKLPEVVALIERSQLVRDWLELAARCECPDLGQCPLFDEPDLPPGEHRPPRRSGLSSAMPGSAGRFGAAPFVQGQDRRRAPAKGDDMRYLCLLVGEPDMDEPVPGSPEFMRMLSDYQSATQAMADAGVLVDSGPLQPASAATTIRVRGGEPLVTDGPFAELKEHIGGYYVLDCADLDEALRWTAMVPAARFGCIEVRPLMMMPGPG